MTTLVCTYSSIVKMYLPKKSQPFPLPGCLKDFTVFSEILLSVIWGNQKANTCLLRMITDIKISENIEKNLTYLGH